MESQPAKKTLEKNIDVLITEMAMQTCDVILQQIPERHYTTEKEEAEFRTQVCNYIHIQFHNIKTLCSVLTLQERLEQLEEKIRRSGF